MVVYESQIKFNTIEDQYKTSVFEQIVRKYIIRRPTAQEALYLPRGQTGNYISMNKQKHCFPALESRFQWSFLPYVATKKETEKNILTGSPESSP